MNQINHNGVEELKLFETEKEADLAQIYRIANLAEFNYRIFSSISDTASPCTLADQCPGTSDFKLLQIPKWKGSLYALHQTYPR